MAIHWTAGPKAGQTLYEGCVLRTGTRTIRVMSDVWEDESYADVWNGKAVVDVVLKDWAYEKMGGGWTKESSEAVKAKKKSYYYQGEQKIESEYESSETHYFYPTTTVDATEEVEVLVGEWRSLLARIEHSRQRLRNASEIMFGKEVEVHKGRKVPLGIYEIASHVRDSEWGSQVHLRDKSGTTYYNISLQNMRVHNHIRYVEGEVTCQECKKDYPSAQLAGMIAGAWANPVCFTCYKSMTLNGLTEVRRPSWAKGIACQITMGHKMVGKPLGEALLSAIIDNPEDELSWMAWADWLVDEDDQQHGMHVRSSIFGEMKPTPKPIRKKDLTASPWKLIKWSQYGVRVFRSIITGIPSTEECDAVHADMNLSCITKDIPRPTLYKHNKDEVATTQRYNLAVRGTLAKVCRTVLPPFPWTLEQVKEMPQPEDLKNDPS